MKHTNFVFILDCSYSMVRELPQIKEDLKNRITSMVSSKEDSFSLLYFSGRNEYGTILENININDLSNLTEVKSTIDRWVKPIGATAYAPPLFKAKDFTVTGMNNILLFITDGWNNDSSKDDVFNALGGLEHYDYKYFIEYGNYCDTSLLNLMAEKCGGVNLTAEDFNGLQNIFSTTFDNTYVAKQKIVVDTNGAERIYVLTEGGDLYTHKCVPTIDIVLEVPADTIYICSDVDSQDKYEKLVCVLAALKRGDSHRVETILKEINSNKLYQAWSVAYGKQKLKEFYLLVKDFILNEDSDDTFITESTATTSVLELFEFMADNGTKVRINGYQKVSKGIDTDLLTKAQQEHLNSLRSKEEMADYLLNIQPLEFKQKGYGYWLDMSNLTFNTKRANVSFLVRQEGTVKLPNNDFGIDYFDTHRYKNFTFIKDGILNITTIEVHADDEVLMTYFKKHKIKTFFDDGLKIDLTQLPIVRKELFTYLSANLLAEKSFALEQTKAVLKALKVEDNLLSKKELTDNPEINEWLKSHGITINGFSPVGAKRESEDFYIAPTLDIKIKSLSSLPSINAVEKKLESGKSLTLSESLVNEGIELAKRLAKVDASVLTTTREATNKTKRDLELSVAKDVFSLILSRGWFSDKEGFEDNKVPYTWSGYETEVTFVLGETQVNI
jgi:hypothetical protein